MSEKLSLLNLRLRLLPSKVESFIDKTKKELKDVVNREDCSEDDVPLDYDLIFNHPRVDIYSFDKEFQYDVNESDSFNDNYNLKKQKKKTMYSRIKKRIINQLSITSTKDTKDKVDKVKSKEATTATHRVTFVKENRVHVYFEEESENRKFI